MDILDPMRANKQRELENYAQIHFRYTKLVQGQAHAMRHNPREKDAAYARVAEESLKDMIRVPMKTTEEMQAILEDLARRTEIGPMIVGEVSQVFPLHNKFEGGMLRRKIQGV